MLREWSKSVLRRKNVERNAQVLTDRLEERAKQRVLALWAAKALEDKSALFYRERMLTQAINKLKVLRALDTMRGSRRSRRSEGCASET